MKGLFLHQGMPNRWKIVFISVRSRAGHVSSHAPPVSPRLCGGLGRVVMLCLTESVCLSVAPPKDKMTNGDISPEEKKQEMEMEKLLEDTSVGENHR